MPSCGPIRPGAGAEDDIELHLSHASGVCIHARRRHGVRRARPAPAGQRHLGGFVIDGFDGQEEQLKAGGSPASLGAEWGVEPESAWGRLYTGGQRGRPVPSERGAWDTYYPAVAAAIAGDGPPPVDPRDAVATAAVLDAARESAAAGRVITLP